MEVMADKGLLLKSISPASFNLPSKNKLRTCGTGVETGQPLEHPGTLHFRHRLASDFIVDIYILRYFVSCEFIFFLVHPYLWSTIYRDFGGHSNGFRVDHES